MSLTVASVSPDQIDLSSELGGDEGFGKFELDRVAEKVIRRSCTMGRWVEFRPEEVEGWFARPNDPHLRTLFNHRIRDHVWMMLDRGFMERSGSGHFRVTDVFISRIAPRILQRAAAK